MAHNRPSRGGPESEGTGEIRFHYSRGERLQHHSAQATGDSEQRRRRLNKRLLIIVLDILLVSVVYLIFVFFLQPDHATADLLGVRFSSQAGYFDDHLLVRVTAERREAYTQPELLELSVYRVGEHEDELLGDELDTLGEAAGDTRRLHLQLGPYADPPQQIRLQVRLREQEIDLLPAIDDF
ncbi:hypothetical protein [Spirochaeta africana]|uniref:Uncharacterized protein n=1 Tax=Spirochaeta africana (strain ATCC 700263 / DSM 8902 / Z-7692) TaxID=889378 RepID=H9UH85_SPIAZ|nr:hypothetical protein [Spirochaeta africana]AFG36878.1 hypothetical protein Spiaf_0784 [Spirochaeta africana DSM 8902]